jgi:putative MFS transporter
LTAEAGLLSSMSFLGMFFGAGSAGLLADRFGRARIFQAALAVLVLGEGTRGRTLESISH